jgi:very-short-patch-repair endonuclease
MRKRINNRIMKKRRQDLRNDSTRTERILWGHLQRSQLGCKFRRQISFDYFIADFYCPSAKLIVELDGDSHFEPGADAYDEERTDKISELGILVIRFTDADVLFDIERVLKEIRDICSLRTKPPLLSKEG